MSARLIDGRELAARICERVRREVESLTARGRCPCLAGVLVGDDDGSRMYAASQAKQAGKVGIDHRLVALPGGADFECVRAAIDELNHDAAVSGILLYQPLPAGLDAVALQDAIAPAKDVEGVHPLNLGRLAMGRSAMVPCTAAAAMACLEASGLDLTGREAVVVGRSAIVGKPVAMLLTAAHATVTTCHTRTVDLAAQTRRAEVLVVAAGKPRIIGRAHVRAGGRRHRRRDASDHGG